jgi:hypothetical protein
MGKEDVHTKFSLETLKAIPHLEVAEDMNPWQAL